MIANEKARMKRLLDEGLSKAAVARQLGRSRQTIYNWLAQQGPEKSPPRRTSKLEPYKPYLDSRLQLYDLPASSLLQEIEQLGYTGKITILRQYVATVKAQEVRRVVERFETEPGRQAQVDWASCGTIVHQGRVRRLSLLVVMLGYSRMIWARFVVSERRAVLLDLLEQALRAFGGVPRELLVDNMKQAIDLARTAERAPVVNAAFQHFADHWGFDVVACPAYWPRAKGKVERSILYLKRSFLEGREFHDLDELNAQLQLWLANTANLRLHGTIKARPIERWAADQEAMRPLLANPYPAAVRAQRRVDHDGFFSYRSVRYSVDPTILGRRRGEEVDIELGTDERLRIFHHGQLVGEHPLAPKHSPPQEDPLHAQARQRLRQRPPDRHPGGKTPRFCQIPQDLELEAVIAQAPKVAQRLLAAYEGVL